MMRRKVWIQGGLGSGVFLLASPGLARAGMPALTLHEVVRLRLETISFFVAVFLVCVVAVRWIWNGLRGDFPGLPRLSFGRAVGLVSLWGLTFLLVLTMISGARELMTPGAWRKDGLTYKLANPPGETDPKPSDQFEVRRARLLELREALWQYAASHDGQFPVDVTEPAIPADAWRLPDPAELRYLYVPGRSANVEARILVYEPQWIGTTRMALHTDGSIRLRSMAEIDHDLEAQPEPGVKP